MNYPRLLIISNNSFSRTGANGRTLANLLRGWPKEKIAQFCLSYETPDFSMCDSIFCVTDGQAMRGLLGSAKGGILAPTPAVETTALTGGKGGLPRNALTMLARELIWSTGRWKRCGFDAWVQEFAPELVLLQAGDSAFMAKLAMNVAKQYSVPVAVFNTENYYFKGFDYFRGTGLAHWLYGPFHRKFQRQMRVLMQQGALFLYSCDKLRKMYEDEFGREGHVAYTPASVIRHGTAKGGPFRVAYLGSLGLGREVPLIEVAEALAEIDPNLYLDVYGGANETVKAAFAACPAIHYHGFVSYEEVQRVMSESRLLVHAEGRDPFTTKDLETAFSTKIADSLGSGTPLLLYAPESIACSEYVREQQCAFYVSTRAELKTALLAAMDPIRAQEKLDRAYEVACENHDPHKTPQRVQELLRGLVQ